MTSGVGAGPSRWARRAPIALLALLGAAIALRLGLYQAGALGPPPDPLFGPASSAAVLGSPLSRALPVPDALVGAGAYALEAVLALMGGPDRVHTAPWLVLAMGLVLAGLVAAGVLLVLAQLFVVRAGCALCLVSALVSFSSAWLGRDEVSAALQEART